MTWDNEDAIYESSAIHPLEEEAHTGLWRTKDEGTIKISEMTDRHLRNAISYAERCGSTSIEKINELKTELARR